MRTKVLLLMKMNHSVCDWQSEPWRGARLWPAQVCHSRTPHRAEKGRQGEIHSSNLGELLSLQPSGTEDSPGDIRDVEDDVTAAQLRTLSSITPLFRPHLCSRFGRPLLSSRCWPPGCQWCPPGQSAVQSPKENDWKKCQETRGLGEVWSSVRRVEAEEASEENKNHILFIFLFNKFFSFNSFISILSKTDHYSLLRTSYLVWKSANEIKLQS